jgi:hypothetical protein
VLDHLPSLAAFLSGSASDADSSRLGRLYNGSGRLSATAMPALPLVIWN